MAEHIGQIGAKTLFATHYHHLNELAGTISGVKNYRIAVKEDDERVIWLRKIMPGGTDKSYGHTGGKTGRLPESVIERAKEVLWQLESSDSNKGVSRRDAKIAKTEKVQLTLFESEPHPVLIELDKIDVGTMTPIEALTKLYDLQNKLKKN